MKTKPFALTGLSSSEDCTELLKIEMFLLKIYRHVSVSILDP